MWPFTRRRERAQIHALIRKYLSEEVADELLNNPSRVRLETQRADICFILMQVRDDPVDQVQAHLETAFDIILRRDGTICDQMASIVLSIFGHPIEIDPERASDQRAKSVARLMTELGANIRLVHGTAAGMIGNIGSPQRFHYGVLLPDFARYLTALTALKFGQSAEMQPT
jgi:hypothetical protein